MDHGCADFDSKPVVPLIIRVRNQSPEKANFKLPLLSEITVNSDIGPQPAAAFYFRWGPGTGFMPAMQGRIEVEVAQLAPLPPIILPP